jgi:hypothetical protein
MRDILLRRNLPHVITVIGSELTEELVESVSNITPRDVILGMAELNKNNISLLEISVGISREGTTKIKSVLEHGGVYKNEEWIDGKEPTRVDFLPEGDALLPFKSDSWALGEFLVRHYTGGKTIPRKFMKTQSLMDKFVESIGTDDEEVLKKLLVLDPYKREYTWNVTVKDEPGCIIQ